MRGEKEGEREIGREGGGEKEGGKMETRLIWVNGIFNENITLCLIVRNDLITQKYMYITTVHCIHTYMYMYMFSMLFLTICFQLQPLVSLQQVPDPENSDKRVLTCQYLPQKGQYGSELGQ